MQRRTFIQTSLTTLGAAAGTETGVAASAHGAETKAGELYELRVYSRKAEKQPILDRYLGRAFIPALKRNGIGPVGVMIDNAAAEPKTYVLIVYPSPEQVATLSARLAADEEYQKVAGDYLAAKASDPVYARIESSLLAPIAAMPRLAKPDASKPRLLNLRIYESHNERANQKKIEMFNTAELGIFRRVGLTPVFFAESIVGAARPNLTYMLVFPDDAGRNAAWTRFRGDAEWQKLRAIPEYADKEIVSKITNLILTPTAYSEF
jgi:NIPSNAP